MTVGTKATRRRMAGGRWVLVLAIMVTAFAAPAAGSQASSRGTRASWARVTTPSSGTDLDAISCLARDRCMAVGGTGSGALVLHWNGKRWRRDQGMRRKYLYLLSVSCPDARFCLVAPGLKQWHNGKWRATYSGRAASFDVSCLTRTDCWAVGSSYSGKSSAMHFDGQAWTPVSLPHQSDKYGSYAEELDAVDCVTPDDCWFVGARDETATGRLLMYHWNGVNATEVALPRIGGDDLLYGVACSSARHCFAVGSAHFMRTTGYTRQLVLKYAGGTWSVRRVGPQGDLTAVECTPSGICYATGERKIGMTGGSERMVSTLLRLTRSSITRERTPSPAGRSGVSTTTGVSCWRARRCFATGYALPYTSWQGAYGFIARRR